MIERNKGKEKKTPMSPKALSISRKLTAMGVKPVKSVDALARGTPKDADDLLEAIRELRERSGELS